MTTFSQRVLDECEPDEIRQFKIDGLTESPADYYFGVQAADDESLIEGVSVVIVPKKLWDRDGYWSDSGAIPLLLEPHLVGYDELMEATFEPDDQSKTVDQIRAELSARGFTENPDIFKEVP